MDLEGARGPSGEVVDGKGRRGHPRERRGDRLYNTGGGLSIVLEGLSRVGRYSLEVCRMVVWSEWCFGGRSVGVVGT